MLQITKQGNSIVVEGLNHYFYPYNGTLEVPCNSVITVVDKGDIVLFRSASNYDVLFSAKIDEITINGQSVTKDNVGEVFGALSNTSSGGGGLTPDQEEKLNNAVQISDYNADKATQTTIDEAQTAEINKLKGDIAGKQDTIQDLNAIRDGAAKGATAIQEETDPIWTAEKVNYYTKSDIDTSLESKANKSEIPTVPTNVSAFTNDAGYLTEHQSLNNYYTKTESDGIYATQVVVNEEIAARISDIREVKATLESKADKSEIPTVPTNVSAFTNDAGYLTEHQSLDNYYTKTEINTSLESKADKTEIPSLNGYATEQWVRTQGYLTEETDPTVPSHVKAITEEDIAKWNQGGYDVYQWSFYPYSYAKENVGFTFTKNGSTITGSQGYIVKYKRHSKTGEIDGTYQTASSESFLFNIPLTDDTIFIVARLDEGSATRLEFSFDVVSNIKGGGITEETDPVWTAEKVNYYTKTESDGIYATQVAMNEEIAARKADIREVNTSLEAKANKSEIPTVPTNVSAFTNDAGYLTEHQTLKTINGETLVGDGNIEISSGEETDPIWNAEKSNYYTKSEIDTSLESKANKSEIPTVPTNVSAFTNDAGYLTEHQSLDNYYTKTEVNTSLETKANKSEIPSLDNYYTKSEIDGIVGNVNNALGEIING